MSIRLRLAAWYTAVLAVTLVVFSLVLYFIMERHLVDEADNGIASRAQHIASTIRVDSSTPEHLKQVELPPIDAFEAPGVYVQVVDSNGILVAHSDNLNGQELPADDQAFAAAQSGHSVFYTSSIRGDQVRVYLQPLVVGGQLIGFVQVGRSQNEAVAVLERLRLGLIGVGLVSLLLAGGTAWGVAGRALEPIATITRTARAIQLSKGFSRRLENTKSHDELGELGRTFNEMLVSLDEAYAAQQRFVADASHELRAPLTAVRANLELLKRQGESLPREERQALATAAAGEADRMGRLVADLLSLARADAGQRLQLRHTELDRLVLDVYSEARLLANGVKLKIEEIDEISLPADSDRLKQLVLILVDNALRYTLKGEVRLILRREGAMAVVEVADTGIGIAPDDLPHIFERFYRADKARARDAAGTGLGLAIAKWIVEQHSGEIIVQSVLGSGSVFIVRLPLARSTMG